MSTALVLQKSPHDVAGTVQRIVAGLERRGVTLFAAVDHAAGARSAGLELPDEVLLVFGNPAVGTALMQSDPRSGIELPLRMLVWSEGGATRIAFRDPAGLADEFSVDGNVGTLAKLRGLLDQLVAEATAG
ncbi:MAG TPA: DUF302 domain-containing protein [Actinoplanes sp.]|jgi:uncharacterized protein (DUF302 family)